MFSEEYIIKLGFDFDEVINSLWIDGVDISNILNSGVKTPFYCYSGGLIKENYQQFDRNISFKNKGIYYAVKANSNLGVLSLLASLGSGADVVSGGELERALAAGINPSHISFAGVGKKREEIIYALQKGVGHFNVESLSELEEINEIADDLGFRAKVLIRVNPNIDANTHEKITTGINGNKFGIDLNDIDKIISKLAKLKAIEVKGLSCHIGSQIFKLEQLKIAYAIVKKLFMKFKDAETLEGHSLDTLDLGGGLGVVSDIQKNYALVAEYGKMLEEVFPLHEKLTQETNFIFEPGRFIVATAGVLVTQVIRLKRTENKVFLIIDAAMNDFMRTALYGQYHSFSLAKTDGIRKEREKYEIVGPICESADYFARDIEMPKLEVGDYITLNDAGAYGSSMGNSYNSRDIIAEVLAYKGEFFLVKKALTNKALMAFEQVIDFSKF